MARKKLLVFCFLLAASLSLYSESLDKIISSAKENSPSYKNTQITYQDGLIDLSKLEKEDEPLLSIATSVTPITKVEEIGDVMAITPEASYTTADRKTNITASIGYSMDYKNTSREYSPSLSASHSFDFSGYDSDTIKDLNYAISKLRTEVAHSEAEYKFEETVINTVSALLSSLKSLDQIDKNLSDAKTNLDNAKSLKTVSEDSYTYKNIANTIESLENSKRALEQRYADAKANYKVFTGLDWDGLDDIAQPNLSLNVLTNGNSNVIIKSLEIQVAEEEYANFVAEQSPNTLYVKGDASGKYTEANGKDSGKIEVGGTLSYNANNWTISAKHTSTWNLAEGSSSSYSPSLKIYGKWTNGTINQSTGSDMSSTRDSLELQKKQNAILSAKNDYIAAMTSYSQSAQDYSVQIMEWNYSKSEIDSKITYLESVLDNKIALFNAGLATEKDVDDARFELDQARYDLKITLLKGLALEREIRIFAL